MKWLCPRDDVHAVRFLLGYLHGEDLDLYDDPQSEWQER